LEIQYTPRNPQNRLKYDVLYVSVLYVLK